jgi:predicted amidohydrolase
MQDLKISFIQADLAWEDPVANREKFGRYISALKSNPHLIVLPETFTTGFPVDPRKLAEQPDGETVQWMKQQAASTGAVICGSILLNMNEHFHNSLLWVTPDGSYSVYNKRHVFRMGGEHKLIRPGTELLDVSLHGWNIRPLVCYDLRFPVWSRNKATDGQFDYDLLIYIANWPEARAFPWKQLLIARAIENQAYVLGVNRVGTDGPGNSYSGDSVLLDPKGNVVASAEASAEAIVETRADHAELLNFREKFNVSLDWDMFNMVILTPDNIPL